MSTRTRTMPRRSSLVSRSGGLLSRIARRPPGTDATYAATPSRQVSGSAAPSTATPRARDRRRRPEVAPPPLGRGTPDPDPHRRPGPGVAGHQFAPLPGASTGVADDRQVLAEP